MPDPPKAKEGGVRTGAMSLNATKAGMQGVDLARANAIIEAASAGSQFHTRRGQLAEVWDKRLDEALARVRALGAAPPACPTARAECERLEKERDLSRVIVCVDFDYFFAQAEELADPSLRGRPMGVGGMGMLSTTNYEARKFGVRAGMPGFIGLKLCPELVIVPGHFDLYKELAAKAREVFALYDEAFTSFSLDEAMLDITEHIATRDPPPEGPEAVVEELRARVFAATGLTCSAGIGANRMIAKVAADVRKPNGQHFVPCTRADVLRFVHALPVRKVPGIGAMQEHLLHGLGIKTVADIYARRDILVAAFRERTWKNLLRVSLGVASSGIIDVNSSSAKEPRRRAGISRERTFRDESNPSVILAKFAHVAGKLASDLERAGCRGKTIIVKIKTSSFRLLTRSATNKSAGPFPRDSDSILDTAWKIAREELAALNREAGAPVTLRLIGIGFTNLAFDDGHDPAADQLPAGQMRLDNFLSSGRAKRKDHSGDDDDNDNDDDEDDDNGDGDGDGDSYNDDGDDGDDDAKRQVIATVSSSDDGGNICWHVDSDSDSRSSESHAPNQGVSDSAAAAAVVVAKQMAAQGNNEHVGTSKPAMMKSTPKSTTPAAPPVTCPLCGVSIEARFADNHVNRCLDTGPPAASSQSSSSRTAPLTPNSKKRRQGGGGGPTIDAFLSKKPRS